MSPNAYCNDCGEYKKMSHEEIPDTTVTALCSCNSGLHDFTYVKDDDS